MCEAVEEYGRKCEALGREEGRREALLESIRNVMKNLKINEEQAMRVLDVPEREYSVFMSKL